MKHSFVCQYCDNSDCECSDQSSDSQKHKTLYSFKEINIANKQLLAEIRIICKNLIYVIGLAPTIAKEEYLRKNEYFGQYGQIQKLIVIQSNTFNPPSHAAYITYRNEQEASLAILVKNPYIFVWPVKHFPFMIVSSKPHSAQQNIVLISSKANNVKQKNVCTSINIQKIKIILKYLKKQNNSINIIQEEMNNSKWLFTYSQRLAQNNFRKFYQKINYKLALNKSIFPTTQNILDRMIDQNYVDPIAVVVKQQQNITEEIIQQPDILDKRVEQIIMKMDTTDQSNSRFKFTTGKNIPLDVETINQLKQYVQK